MCSVLDLIKSGDGRDSSMIADPNMAENNWELRESRRRHAAESEVADQTTDCGLPDVGRVNPEATLRVIRQRLAEIELCLTYSKARQGTDAGTAADQQLLEIIGTDFV